MSKRINAILNNIDKEDIVLDIGCDMAHIGINLAKKGIISYAGDIKENIISRAKENAKKLNLDKFINFKTSDGLKEFVNISEINTLVLAGMGTYTILNILKESERKYNKIITISNNDHLLLRTEMLKLGYKIKLEEIIFEKNKYYNLIVFIPGKRNYSEIELNLGYNHQNHELLIQRNMYLIDKYKSLSEEGKEKYKNILQMLEK